MFLHTFSWGNNNESSKIKMEIFLKDCVEIIENIGIKKEEKKNILSRLPDWLIPLIATALVIVGIAYGRYQKDVAFIRMEEKLTKIQDSLSALPANKIPEKVKQVDSEKKN
jgi:hypothetical protein